MLLSKYTADVSDKIEARYMGFWDKNPQKKNGLV
jgi:hypothetical protein